MQIAASIGRLNGLLIFRSAPAARTFGLALVVAAFVWFFTSEQRNINDYEGGLDANLQALFLFLGAVTALAATLTLASIRNARLNDGEPVLGEGLDALKRTNYARALFQSIHFWLREWRTQMKPYFFG
jgi:hypothetical protein